MPELREVIISLTNRCNLRCRMCDIPLQDKGELPVEVWEKVIQDAASLSAKTIVFSGGEPLLREDLFRLISFVKKNLMQACITSNGYLLDEKNSSMLAASGIGVVNISVEGPRELHDSLRCKGSFGKALLALDNLKKHNIESTIATVVSGLNYRHLMSMVGLAREHGVTTIKFQPFSSIFLESGREPGDFLIPRQEEEELNTAINEVARACEIYGIATNPRGYLEKIPAYLVNGKKKRQGACPALSSSCPIDPAGRVYPCWVLSGSADMIGNIKETGLSKLWNSEKRAGIIARVSQEGCPGCMMSCYDENFGKESLESRIAVNIGRFKQEGAHSYSKRLLRKLAKRLAFYLSYRGTLKMSLSRLKKLFRRKASLPVALSRKDIDIALAEIKKAKCIIEEELNKLK